MGEHHPLGCSGRAGGVGKDKEVLVDVDVRLGKVGVDRGLEEIAEVDDT